MEIKATVPELGNLELTADVPLGGNIEEATALFGTEVVYNAYLATAVIRAQAYMRGLARKEKSAEEITVACAAYKLGVARVASDDSLSSIVKKFSKLPADKQKGFLAKLLASQQEENSEPTSEPTVVSIPD